MKYLSFILIPAAILLSACTMQKPEFLSNFKYNEKEFSNQYKINKAEWDAAIDFLQNTDLQALPVGEWQQLTDRTKGRTQKVFTAQTRGFEAHRRTIDVFYVVDGQDRVGISSLDKLIDRTKEYSEARDVETFAASTDPEYVILEKGQGVILFPCDAHSPNLCVAAPDSMLLSVVKIPYDSITK